METIVWYGPLYHQGCFLFPQMIIIIPLSKATCGKQRMQLQF